MLRSVETEQTLPVPEFPVVIDSLVRLLNVFPDISIRFLVDLVYPFPLLPSCDPEQRKLIYALYKRFSIARESAAAEEEAGEQGDGEQEAGQAPPSNYGLVRLGDKTAGLIVAQFFNALVGKPLVVNVHLLAGPRPSLAAEFFVETTYHQQLLWSLLHSHSVGADICIVGQKGTGKSAIVRHLAGLLGYAIEFVSLYKVNK